MPRIHPARWTRLRDLVGWGNRYVEELVGQVLRAGPWNLAIYSRGASTPNLHGQWTKKVPVFKFWLHPRPLVPWG